MNKKNKILIISGDLLKHKYVAIRILKEFGNSNVIFEKYPKNILKKYSKKNSTILRNHFNNVKKYEKKNFKNYCRNNNSLLKKKTLFQLTKRSINSNKTIEKIKKYDPKLIIVNATSILKDKFLHNFKNKIINIHAGLLPYYKGTGCNVWTFYNQELEYTGVSIHFVNKKIDDGNIITQKQSLFIKDDNTHSIGCKNAILGAKLVIKSIKFLIKNPNYKGKIIKTKNKKIFFNKDFTKDTVLKVNNLIKDGIIRKYCKNKKKVKIITIK